MLCADADGSWYTGVGAVVPPAAAVTETPTFVRFGIPYDGDGDNLHFEIEISANMDFNTILLTADSSTSQTRWKVFGGTNWEDVPSGGVPVGYTGNMASYQVTAGVLTPGTVYYVRYRADDGTAPTGWRGMILSPDAY